METKPDSTKTKEYKEGWNASNGGNVETIFANPYLGEQGKLWSQGWKDNVKAWNSDSTQLPKNL